ncbi:uncharacterized protein BXZ73DRAFT_104682 [Epithele typhae]|uniref:uncharacterized protein n=1 Tax=Epithele typhae TaxID=378194 RepID=UPI002008DE57|nr:uncharacterized protein BXZ73DRAFT_104682 [Epithele typhae]KAH9920557.1 hypothetical protein BXZ73DRAFT_104682 [Epithele typhae]
MGPQYRRGATAGSIVDASALANGWAHACSIDRDRRCFHPLPENFWLERWFGGSGVGLGKAEHENELLHTEAAFTMEETRARGDGEASLDGFAAAISARYASQATSLIPLNSPDSTPHPPPLSLAASLPGPRPGPPPQMMPSLSLPSMASPPATAPALPPSSFSSLAPSALLDVLDDPSALVLDIRPHNAWVQARLPHALSLSVPSTLLKRPNFPLAKLAEMLPTPAARARLASWSNASRILIYDADSAVIPPTSNLLGLMRKFRNEGFPPTRDIAWLRGGFHAAFKESPDMAHTGSPADEGDEDEADVQMETDRDPAPLTALAPARVLRAKLLPQSAFTSTTTIPIRPRQPPPSSLPVTVLPPTPLMPRDDPVRRAPIAPTPSTSGLPPVAGPSRQRNAFALRLPPGQMDNKPADTRSTTDASNGPLHSMPTISPQYTHSGAFKGGNSYSAPGKPVAYNPFFDTIRQNIELNRNSKTADSEGIPLKLPRRVRRRVGELPFEWLRQIARKSRHVPDSTSTSDDGSDPLSESDGVSGDEKMASASDDHSHSKSPSNPTAVPPSAYATVSSAAFRSPQASPFSSPSLPIPIPPSRPRESSEGPALSEHSQSPSDADELTRALETQFYNIELGEQKRLLGVMERHSMESGKVIQEAPGVRGFVGIAPPGMAKPASAPGIHGEDAEAAAVIGEEAISSFPYSITAGLEKGAKNRYRNIWPFEHARVRLRKYKPDDDDYMNASYVQPLGTSKRYIATQGPLPTTFTDFWTLCWEQNVHVIVMLTREIEGSSVKCGKYWEEGTYGPLQLHLIETNDTPERERKREEKETGGGFFSAHLAQADAKLKAKQAKDDGEPSTLKRVFELTNTAYPLAPPRIVTQFQYLEWPDLNVPDDPRGLLQLIHDVENTVERARSTSQNLRGEGPFGQSTKKGLPLTHGKTIVTNKDNAADEVDASTGVAMLAKDNAPVLLHCSAGVGRTGGFIAVDAVLDGVRREMRKRKAGRVKDSVIAQAASEFQGRSGAPEEYRRIISVLSEAHTDAMDVDPPAPPSDPTADDDSQLTVPVPVGDREVHVPVAGFTQVLMDVDAHSRPALAAPKSIADTAHAPPYPSGAVLQASSELVEEVRRAAMGVWPATPRTEAAAFRLTATSAFSSGDSSDASAGPSSGNGSGGNGTNLLAPRSSSPTMSASDGLPSSVVGRTARLSVNSPDTAPTSTSPHPSSTPASASNMVASSPSPPQTQASSSSSPSLAAQSQRLNTWRSEVQSSKAGSSPSPPAALASATSPLPLPLPSSSTNKPRNAFQTSRGHDSSDDTIPVAEPSPPLRDPRKLHSDSSPPLLSTYDEPIRRVIEDMREQRMSLCQSLRQYVFVHRAIIEGSLMVVDEEKRQAKRHANPHPQPSQQAPQHTQHPPQPLNLGTHHATLSLPRLASPFAPDTAGSAQSASPARALSKKRSVGDVNGDSTFDAGASPGRPKRGASPTELLKEGLDGAVLLTKRPSLKRQGRDGANVPPPGPVASGYPPA